MMSKIRSYRYYPSICGVCQTLSRSKAVIRISLHKSNIGYVEFWMISTNRQISRNYMLVTYEYMDELHLKRRFSVDFSYSPTFLVAQLRFTRKITFSCVNERRLPSVIESVVWKFPEGKVMLLFVKKKA